MKKLILLGVIILTLAWIVPSQAANDSSKDSNDGTIIYGITGTWGSLNPFHIVHYRGTTIHDKLWETLFSIDEDGNLIKRSCDSYQVVDDGKAYIIKLRKDVKWHDGQPVTAHDWEFAARMIADPAVIGLAGKTYPAKLSGIDKKGNIVKDEPFGLVAVDDYTLKMTLDKPSNFELFMLNYNRHFHPLPKHILGKVPASEFVRDKFWLNPVGCGPFKFVSTIPGQEVVLEANKDFYYPIHFKTLVIKLISASNIVSSIISGAIDVCPMVQLEDLEELRSAKGVTVYKAHQTEYFYCHINTKLCNNNVRKAINYAIDKQLIIDQILYGEGIPAEVSISPESPYCDTELPTGRDVEKAKALLKEGNWNSNQVIKLATPADFRKKVAVIMQQNLAEAGIKLELTFIDQTSMQAGLRKGIYDMGMQVWGMHYKNPTYFQICQNPGSSINLSNIDYNEYIDLTSKIDSCQDKDVMHNLIQDYIKLMRDDLGHIGIAHKNSYTVWGPRIASGPSVMSHDLSWQWKLK